MHLSAKISVFFGLQIFLSSIAWTKTDPTDGLLPEVNMGFSLSKIDHNDKVINQGKGYGVIVVKLDLCSMQKVKETGYHPQDCFMLKKFFYVLGHGYRENGENFSVPATVLHGLALSKKIPAGDVAIVMSLWEMNHNHTWAGPSEDPASEYWVGHTVVSPLQLNLGRNTYKIDANDASASVEVAVDLKLQLNGNAQFAEFNPPNEIFSYKNVKFATSRKVDMADATPVTLANMLQVLTYYYKFPASEVWKTAALTNPQATEAWQEIWKYGDEVAGNSKRQIEDFFIAYSYARRGVTFYLDQIASEEENVEASEKYAANYIQGNHQQEEYYRRINTQNSIAGAIAISDLFINGAKSFLDSTLR